MTTEKNHIGSNFDDFLKEENVEIKPNIVFLREKFNNKLHIEEISYGVCIAFREKGHEAYSCDIEPCSGGHPEWHMTHLKFVMMIVAMREK